MIDVDDLRSNGFTLARAAVPSDACATLVDAWDGFASNAAKRCGGVRVALTASDSVRRTIESSPMSRIAGCAMVGGAFPVRVIAFDKTPVANWKVTWHQDLTIAVNERMTAPGFGPWTVKAGVVHVQPPLTILERVVALRLHLDDCDPDNGPLRLIAGSHRAGRLSPEQILHYRRSVPETVCIAKAGDVLVMSPLVLHASAAATSPAHRRVLHVEYASCSLPNGLEWAEPSRTPSITPLPDSPITQCV